MDLEAVENALRSALHHAGAAALSELLQFEPPAADQRQLPCPCGHRAQYQELRSKAVLTVVGPARMLRPYYLCSHCHQGQFPADVELDVEGTEFSPGVRRMLAVVGQAAPFDNGREQMKLLAALDVTTKAVERTAETIGEDIGAREREQIQRAVQLDLPVIVGEPVPILYVQMDGTGIPVTKAERREGKSEGLPAHTREVKLGCSFTQTTWDQEGYAIRDPDSTTYTGAIETAAEFGRRIYLEAWNKRLEPGREESGDWRRGRVDLEHRRGTLSRSHSDCRSISCASAPLGSDETPIPGRRGAPESLDTASPEQTG
jgi:hypothetical protein